MIYRSDVWTLEFSTVDGGEMHILVSTPEDVLRRIKPHLAPGVNIAIHGPAPEPKKKK